jgi:hypothetical protein
VTAVCEAFPRLSRPNPACTPRLRGARAGLIFPKRERLSAAQALRDLPAAAAAEGPALRLQSANFTPAPVDAPGGGGGGKSSRLGGGFFDLSQMRWRSGNSVTAPAAGGRGGPPAAGGSTNSLRWLLRGQAIPEGGGDVETAGDGDSARSDLGGGEAAAAGAAEAEDAGAAAGGDAVNGGAAAGGGKGGSKGGGKGGGGGNSAA